MKQKWRTKRLLALALLLVFVLGLAWASQIAGESVAGSKTEVTPMLPLGGAQLTAPNCTSPQWDLDSGGGVNLHCQNNVYVVSVDLRHPEVEVVPVEVYRPNSLTDVGDSDDNIIAVINGDYTDGGCSGTRCAQGLFYIDGDDKTNTDKLCRDALKRRVLALSADGRPLIDWWYALVDNPQSICPDLIESGGGATSYRYHVVSGGPIITYDNGTFRWECLYGYQEDGNCESNGWEVVINEEHFGTSAATNNWYNREQTVVGYTTDGNRLLLAVTNGGVSINVVHDVLWNVAQHHGQTLKAALRYDGGSVSGLYYRRNPTYSITPNVPVANAWAVRRRTGSPPPAPSLISPCNDQQFVSCANITLDWDESSGATQYQAKYEGPSSRTSDWMTGTSWNVGTLSPGNYSWQARAKNEWGESPWKEPPCTFRVNSNQAPNIPSPISPNDDAWVNSRTITLQWQDNGDPDNCPRNYRTYNVEIFRSGWSNSVSNYSGTSWQVTVPSDDDYQWRVQAHDGDLPSGWTDYRTVKVDATPPDTSITNGPSGVIPTGSATFTWTGSDNRTSTGDLVYSYRLVGLSNDWSSWSTATSVTYNGLTDGDYTFEVKSKDKAGNEDQSPASHSFGVDVTPPETTITGGPSGCIGTADVAFTWTGSDNRTPTAELLYSCKLEGFDANWSAWTGATSKSHTNLPNGDYTFKVKARDGVGHEDPSPAARSFRVDTTPPMGSILVNGGDSTANKITVHLDISGDDGPVGCGVTEMRLSNDGFNWEAWQPFTTEGEWLLPTLNRTTWTVHLQLKDLVGNVSEAFTDDIYLDLYPPRPSSESYQLGARVVASGDPTSISESYGLLSATMGQPIADARMQGADYRLESGYQGAWPSVPRGRPTPESYDINASVMASSGGYQTSESYRLQSAMGQSMDVGPRSSENYQLLSGYLPCKLIGDLNVNGLVNVADIMRVASRWRCRRGDDCYHERYDLDKDGDIDVVDIMLVVVHWGETC